MQLDIPDIKPDESITNSTDRNKDYEKRLYNFEARIDLIKQRSSPELANQLTTQIEEYKTESSICNNNNTVPILGLSRGNWNFLLEGEDFEISLSGIVKWKL
jgi:hypothetical protein